MRVLFDKKGQTLVLIALLMVALAAMAALVLDGGHGYMERRRMQNAADAGALAGARELAMGALEADAEITATTYAVTHNGADDPIGFEVRADGHEVVVTTTKTFSTWFAGVIGQPEMTVRARAVARYDPAVGGAFAPIALYKGKVDHALVGDPSPEMWIWDSWKEIGGEWDDVAGANRGWLGLDCGPEPSKCSPDAASVKYWMMEGGWPYSTLTLAEYMGDVGTMTSALTEEIEGNVLTVPIYDVVFEYTHSSQCDPDHPNNQICKSEVMFDFHDDGDEEPTQCDDIIDAIEDEENAPFIPPGDLPIVCDDDKCCCEDSAWNEEIRSCRPGPIQPCNLVPKRYNDDPGMSGFYTFNIIGIIGFEIIDVVGTGNPKYIVGEYQENTVAYGQPGDVVDIPGGFYGVWVVRLID